MTDLQQRETEVAAVEYVGPHPVRTDLYELALTLRSDANAPPIHLTLLFRPAEAALLAHMLHLNPPRVQPEDHLAVDLEGLQT